MSNDLLLSVCRDVRHAPAPGHMTAQDGPARKLREAVIRQQRFQRRCHFCDFAFGSSEQYEVHHLDGDHANTDPANLVPVCVLCHAPFHLDLVARRWKDRAGTIIFLPEVSQAHLNNLLQVIFFAKAEQMRQGASLPKTGAEPPAEAPESPTLHATSLYIDLTRRAALVEQLPDGSVGRPGLSKPATLARVLTEMSDADYARRDTLLHGLRYLPDELVMLDESRQWKDAGAAFSQMDVAAWGRITGTSAQG